MPALLSYTRPQKRAGQPAPEVTPVPSSQEPDPFQPAASQVTLASRLAWKCPSPAHKQQNPVWLGRSHPHLGRRCRTKCCCLRLRRIPVSGKGGQRGAPAWADTGSSALLTVCAARTDTGAKPQGSSHKKLCLGGHTTGCAPGRAAACKSRRRTLCLAADLLAPRANFLCKSLINLQAK